MVRAVVAAAIGATALLLASCGDGGGDAAARQEEVARRGASVMPFDLDLTTHVFDATSIGGVQTVVADDPADAEQIALIREHLAQEARKFRTGDFSDPAHIHGDDMPGLAQLQAGFGDVGVTYSEIDSGARIFYETADPTLVAALHDWFDAQRSDHGAHAEHGEPG